VQTFVNVAETVKNATFMPYLTATYVAKAWKLR